MALPDSKELIKLANACRKAGIKHFKGDGIEFTLTDDLPITKPKHVQKQQEEHVDPFQGFTSDELPYEALLNWSVTTGEPTEEKEI